MEYVVGVVPFIWKKEVNQSATQCITVNGRVKA